MANPMTTPDLLVVGAGIAGLYAALTAARLGLSVQVVCAGPRLGGASKWAQGGIAAPLSQWDKVDHAADTLAAGRGLCRENAVQAFVAEAQAHVEHLAALGVPFAPDMALEGGHSQPRVRHAYGDATGLAISEVLGAAAERAGIAVREHTQVQGLLLSGGRVVGANLVGSGAVAGEATSTLPEPLRARAVLLATGGYTGLFPTSTGPRSRAASGLVLAALAGATLRDLEFVQFHPTAVHAGGRALLVSEAVRGAGGVLRNTRGERFMPALDPQAELAPRDVVARAIAAEHTRTGGVTLDISHLGRAEVERCFPSIAARLAQVGLDLAGGPVPVQPAAHYSVGGIKTDLSGSAGVRGLYAAGEVASTGLHGANRLASNSLSEGLVFGARVAHAVAEAIAAGHLPALTRHTEATPQLAASGGTWAAWQPQFAQAAGLVRTGEALASALAAAPRVLLGGECASDAEAQAQAALLARGVAQAALARRETRGTHARADFPTPTDPPRHSELRLESSGDAGLTWAHRFCPAAPAQPASQPLPTAPVQILQGAR